MSKSRQAFVEEAIRKLQGDVEHDPTAIVLMIIAVDGREMQCDLTCWGDAGHMAACGPGFTMATKAMAAGEDEVSGVIVRGH